MNYAIINGATVVNVIVGPLPARMDGVPLGEIPAGIGDVYADGVFTRDGVRLLTPLETAQTLLAETDNAYIALEYDYVMLQLGITE